MLDDRSQTERSLTKTNRACRFISGLMKVIFALMCIWWLISVGVMCGSLLRPELFNNGNPVNGLTLAIYVISVTTMVVICITLIRIFSDASKGDTPFAMMQVRRLRLVAAMLLTYAVLEFAMSCNATFAQQEWISSSVSSAVPTLNLFPFMAAVVIFAFSFVFKYGVLLQELSDETL